MERTLREGRECAHRLDLVAEEFGPERLAAGRREDVDDASPHGELAALIHPLHTLVARKRKRLRQPFDAGLESRPQLDRVRANLRLRQPFRERPRRGADEPAARQHVERPRPLADKVRRGREPRRPRYASARQQADRLVAEEPGGALGGVARVRVLRHEHDELTLEPFVQRREQERQRRLRHAGARGQRVRELAETLVLDELPNECVQYRTVHDEGRNRLVPRASMVTRRLEAYIPGRARGWSLRAAERTAVPAALVRTDWIVGRRLAHPRRAHLGREPRPRRRSATGRPRSRLLP